MYPIKAKERLDTMSKKLFSEEEIAAFRNSPYVESVSDRSLVFTLEFKEMDKANVQKSVEKPDITKGKGKEESL